MTYLLDLMLKARAGFLGSGYELQDTRYGDGASRISALITDKSTGKQYRLLIIDETEYDGNKHSITEHEMECSHE